MILAGLTGRLFYNEDKGSKEHLVVFQKTELTSSFYGVICICKCHGSAEMLARCRVLGFASLLIHKRPVLTVGAHRERSNNDQKHTLCEYTSKPFIGCFLQKA